MRKEYKILLCWALLLKLVVFCSAQTQDIAKYPTPVIPPSPNAAELGRYGNVPVGLFTGTVNQNVPIADIPIGNYSLSLSLNYNSSGVRVPQEASHVGLSWSLNAGGAITRSVIGLPDEEYYLLQTARLVPTTGEMEPREDFLYYLRLSENLNYDTQPDMFYYNFDGKSGRFFFDQNKVAYCAKQDNIKITWVNTNKFEIITENGLKYIFEDVETSSNDNKLGTVYYFPSTWYLSKICLPDNTELVKFNYTSYSTQTKQYQSNTFTHSNSIYGPGAAPSYCSSDLPEDPGGVYVTEINARILHDIVFRTGKIEFEISGRQDHLMEKKIDKIVIRNNDTKIKEVSFNYSYFNNTATVLETDLKRLKLESISFKDRNSLFVNQYTFVYEESVTLPQKSSWSQDHWGFYNGKTNAHLVPTYYYTYTDNTGAWSREITGADRSTDYNYMKAGVLKEIKYPTGGTTKFTYEANDIGGGTEMKYPEMQVTKTAITNIPNGTYTSELTFSVNKDVTNATIRATFPAKDYLDANGIKCSPSFTFTNTTTGQSVIIIGNFSYTQDLFLGSVSLHKNNVYKIKVNETDSRCYSSSSYTSYLESELRVSFSDINISVPQVQVDIPKREIGGLRIQKIENYNGFDNIIQTRSFDYSAGYNLSSGVLMEEPVYAYEFQIHQSDPVNPPPGACPNNPACIYIVRKSNSLIELGTVQGNHVCYPKVTEILGTSGENGKVEYEYSFVTDPGGANNTPGVYPFPPVSSYDFFRGNLLKQTSYNNDNQIVSKTTNIYDSRVLNSVTAMKVAQKWGGVDYNVCLNPEHMFGTPLPFYDNFYNPNYYLINGISRIKESSHIIYSTTGNIETITKYDYNSDYLSPSKVETRSSNGLDEITYSNYFFDYNPGITSIDFLRNNFVLSPVEVVSLFKKTNGTTFVKSGRLVKYSASKGWLPSEIHELELNAPLSLTGWKFSNSNIGTLPQANTPGNYTPSTLYKRKVEVRSFDGYGNIGEIVKEDDYFKSYIWGYNLSVPITEVINANQKDIFHTSFEEGEGNSADGDSKTGRKSKTGGFSKTLTGLTSGDYVLSYWQKSGGTWNLQKSIVTVSGGSHDIIIPADKQVDEIRFYPKTARITTYTYEPLIGMTSQCNENDEIVYYEYDSFGRLQTVRDKEGRVIKTNDYQYQQPNN